MLIPRSLTRRGAIAAALGVVGGGAYAFAHEQGEAVAGPERQDGLGRPRPGGPTATSSAAAADPPPATAAASSPAGLQLPRGGRVLLPAHRLVGYCGAPGAKALGRLGVGDLDARVRELERLGTVYTVGRTVLPVLELIAVIVQSMPGRDGLFRSRVDASVIATYLAAARRHRALLLLNVQPGRARFIDEVHALERWLHEPDVGLALDPEWAVRRGQVPGRVFGQTSGRELDQVAAWLAAIVAAGQLPEKALVVHQLAPHIVRDWGSLRSHPGVVVIKSVDGIGPPKAKLTTWRRLVAGLPAGVRPGFKLFFDEDAAGPSRLMTPAEVLALRPVPDYVMYE